MAVRVAGRRRALETALAVARVALEHDARGAPPRDQPVRPGADGSGSSVSATAHWHPSGVAGLLYWFTLVPAHLFLFRGLTRAIQRRASAEAYSGNSSLRGPK